MHLHANFNLWQPNRPQACLPVTKKKVINLTLLRQTVTKQPATINEYKCTCPADVDPAGGCVSRMEGNKELIE